MKYRGTEPYAGDKSIAPWTLERSQPSPFPDDASQLSISREPVEFGEVEDVAEARGYDAGSRDYRGVARDDEEAVDGLFDGEEEGTLVREVFPVTTQRRFVLKKFQGHPLGPDEAFLFDVRVRVAATAPLTAVSRLQASLPERVRDTKDVETLSRRLSLTQLGPTMESAALPYGDDRTRGFIQYDSRHVAGVMQVSG